LLGNYARKREKKGKIGYEIKLNLFPCSPKIMDFAFLQKRVRKLKQSN